ncbi:RICIN domain-containing protein [Rugosimonospora africana]|uniref:Ricin B lectin domain-containing protein n=1 Tax=Rugosimonospora africana TaxID=556532 RepID=A0A8J3VUJ6_9ACTN|nr:RICIN domain-containing protein [Rugosimonospora africana]GIH18806.1 hypothetical protein Raf01_69780 [Rugosimonospora africana]
MSVISSGGGRLPTVPPACAPTATDQQFRAVAVTNNQYNLMKIHSGRCVDVSSGAATSGPQLQQWGNYHRRE